MITFSIIRKSQLEGAYRLDAEYYQPSYLDTISNLKNQNAKPLNDFLRLLYRYPTFYNLQYYEKGVLVLKGEDILPEGFIHNQSQDYISEEDAKRFPKTILKRGDLIFSVRGYVGKVGIVDEKYDGSIISANLIRAVVKDVSPYFLWIFLNSQYGINQINKVKMITAQETIVADDIKKFLISPVTQEKQLEIEKLAEQAISELRNSEDFYSQAENILLEELGLKDFKVEDDLSYIVNLSKIKSARRADAEYFQPQYDKLVEKLKKYKAKLLKELVRRVKTKIRPKSEEIYKYIEISDISVGSGDVSFNEIIGKELPANARIPIKGDELLVSKVRPTRGAIAIVPNNFNSNFICSGAFSVFGTAEILKEYLFVVLRSTAGKLQFEKPTTGTSYPTITDEDVENLIIPILPKPTQQKIADLVKKSHEARSKAKQLLGQARNRVENLVKVKS